MACDFEVSNMGIESAERNVPRLIEVDLPIRQISANSSREKSVRDGHISTLHIWWARRPLGACRAVVCATLWPDPAHPDCPESFVRDASQILRRLQGQIGGRKFEWGEPLQIREALLSFIAQFSDWDNTCRREFLEASRALTASAHAALGGSPGTSPLIVDPFAGGGSIPLEASRVGGEAFASDLNPLPVLLNKVIIEFIPKYGKRLASELRNVSARVQEAAWKEIVQYFPPSHGTEPPVAYLWARQVTCEGPGCGVSIPLIRSLLLAKRGASSVGLGLAFNSSKNEIEVKISTGGSFGPGTVKRGSASCPACGYTTPVASVRRQLGQQHGGADSSRLLAVVCRSGGSKSYHPPTEADLAAVRRVLADTVRSEALAPQELPLMSGVFNAPIYGMTRWDLLFSARQLLVADAIGKAIEAALAAREASGSDPEFEGALRVLLLFARGKYLDFRSTLCGWISTGEKIGHTFGRQALGMIFDWTEGSPFGDMSGSWQRSYDAIADFIEHESSCENQRGSVSLADATDHPLPDG
ncbi:DUF1156 domain-containing protein, partial [Candidatus Woesearchaeota archaeon]|nr:DUF1156 domain-containing protein [Candidatus Woesearchaeota archaeon]